MEVVFEAKNMAAPGNNVFGLQNPEKHDCRLWKYSAGHSVLVIRVSLATTSHFYLVFEPMLFFEGPMSWMGANFCTGTLDEWARLMHKLQATEKLAEDALPKTYNLSLMNSGRLFRVNTLNIQIRILADTVRMTNDISFLEPR